jgi:hypothetical protein
MEKQKTKQKSRYWAFVVYPEGNPPAPTDWVDRLQQTGLKCAISPLHDCDLDPTGTPKKAHWHVIACWDGPTTANVVKAITDALNAPTAQALNSVGGYYRYLTHKDNPEKHQYSESDIKTLNGFNVADYCELTRREVNDTKIRLIEFIKERNLLEYSDLLEILLRDGMALELDIAMNQTVLFTGYLRSRRHRAERLHRADTETGEVIG